MENTSYPVLYAGVEVILLTSFLWIATMILSGFQPGTRTIAIVGTGVVSMSLTVVYARLERNSSVFPAWPVDGSFPDILVRALGYNGSVGLGVVVGFVVAGGVNSTVLGACSSGIGAIWFFKHLNFFLEFGRGFPTTRT